MDWMNDGVETERCESVDRLLTLRTVTRDLDGIRDS